LLTERSFVSRLEALDHFFRIPLQARAELRPQNASISLQQTIRIFMPAKHVLDIHRELLRDIEILHHNRTLFKDMLWLVERHKMQIQRSITPYFVAFNHASEAIKALYRQSEAFREFVTIAEKCAEFPIQSLLVEPIQRCKF
jgi:hypothetical protein